MRKQKLSEKIMQIADEQEKLIKRILHVINAGDKTFSVEPSTTNPEKINIFRNDFGKLSAFDIETIQLLCKIESCDYEFGILQKNGLYGFRAFPALAVWKLQPPTGRK